MTIDVAIRIDEEFVATERYESSVSVPIPEVGESIVNPQTDGLVVKVARRIFEYRKDYIQVTLDCDSPSGSNPGTSASFQIRVR
jgi:galactokinase/mevalonate kinase-like predicted kinase